MSLTHHTSSTRFLENHPQHIFAADLPQCNSPAGGMVHTQHRAQHHEQLPAFCHRFCEKPWSCCKSQCQTTLLLLHHRAPVLLAARHHPTSADTQQCKVQLRRFTTCRMSGKLLCKCTWQNLFRFDPVRVFLSVCLHTCPQQNHTPDHCCDRL